MDWSVGQIMATVEKLGLRENTFVYFTSDNGPHLEEVSNTGEYHGGWNGIFKGGKGQCWDGGVRMPTVVSWPGHIPAGISIDQLTIPNSGMVHFKTRSNYMEVSQARLRGTHAISSVVEVV
ncbi:steryl-sulfatase-like [Pocillopora damicornis]|uniref:steryl-sulfatase-like n=1 Tax=Pocillopora damicornis TaxID=46731 RepID=UPI000F550389|nr:steryl-sulfatase-like [Pocillopora damicornis]